MLDGIALACYNMCIIQRKDFSVKKITLKKLLPEQKTVRFLISVLLLTLGIYLSYPIHGIVSTLPIGFIIYFFAYLVFDQLGVHVSAVAGIAFF